MRILLSFLFLLASLYGQFVPNQYIVELKDDAADKPLERRTRIRARQGRVETALGARGYRTKARTENVANTLIVEGPDDGSDPRALMRQMSDVANVYKVRIFKKSLDKVAQVHAVKAVWDQIGIDKAGAGMKIGILDSGIELKHPGFQDDSLPLPDGFPKVNADRDLVYTNHKVIVARSYSALFSRTDPDPSALDRSGHGTAVAMCAAGKQHDASFGTIAGMAPAAYLGVYKIFGTPGFNDGATDAAILKAIDDAVADGMDVINLSFGTELAARPENDIIVKALQRAEDAGVIAVVAAGNDGPGKATLGSPASAPTALTAGANENGHVFASALVVNGNAAALAMTGSRTANSGTIEGPLTDITALDSSMLACATLPLNSLTGKIALILRGTCNFSVKVANAARAGATAAVIYSDEARADDFFTMDVGTATLPAVFIKYADGAHLLEQLGGGSTVNVLLDLAIKAREADPSRLASFSSKGPVPGVGIKPDALAVGTNVHTAAQTNYSAGDVYSSTGYAVISGTSFSSPVTAGMVAVLKSARPGLAPVEYRSLLVNNSQALGSASGLTVQQTGAGVMDLSRAMTATLRFNPISVTFTNDQQQIEVRNLAPTAASYHISVEPKQGVAPAISTTQLDLDAGATAQLALKLDRAALDVGAHTGVVIVQADGGTPMRIPYWYGKSNVSAPAELQILLSAPSSARSGTSQQDLIFFRVLDADGIAVEKLPQARIVTGTGTIREVQSRDFDLAGSYGLDVVLGFGVNVIEVDAGNNLTYRFTILGR